LVPSIAEKLGQYSKDKRQPVREGAFEILAAQLQLPSGTELDAKRLELIGSGLITGGVYALVALGMNLQYGLMRILNIAHGEFLMVGAYLSRFKGRGMDFEELREYIPGDDVRDIDWNVTNRMGRPFVKRHREERELGIVLAVDISASGAFGSVRRSKREFAAAAEKYSHCPSATAGGNIGAIYRKGGIVEEPFAKAAFALKVNELSSVIETDFGFHILQVTDRKPGTPTSYDKAATEVLDTYTDDFRAELIAKLRKQGQVQVTVP